MAKQASVFTRVDPMIKEQAEAVLGQLGISMATAMEMYLRQIAMQRKIPFEMALPNEKPIVLGNLSDDEFNALIGRTMRQYADGQCSPIEEFEDELKREYGI